MQQEPVLQNHQPLTQANALQSILRSARFDSPLGSMMIVADDVGLYLADFDDSRRLDRKIKRVTDHVNAKVIPGMNPIIENVFSELSAYFQGRRLQFKTPLHSIGTIFQKRVWIALSQIPMGETQSYADLAKSINAPTAYRAVAQANASNLFSIIVPCHRVINSNQTIGGYAGGVDRKQWLLAHEKRLANLVR